MVKRTSRATRRVIEDAAWSREPVEVRVWDSVAGCVRTRLVLVRDYQPRGAVAVELATNAPVYLSYGAVRGARMVGGAA